jgi:predicted DNA-binding transcriptional regulator
VGVTAFINKLETRFLNQLKDDELPRNLDPNDRDSVRAWFKEAFGLWFLKHRDDLLAREWARRGWAEYILKPTESGGLKEIHRVRPECVEKIDAWLQDEID